MFSGLRSKCAHPNECMDWTPRQISLNSCRNRFSFLIKGSFCWMKLKRSPSGLSRDMIIWRSLKALTFPDLWSISCTEPCLTNFRGTSTCFSWLSSIISLNSFWALVSGYLLLVELKTLRATGPPSSLTVALNTIASADWPPRRSVTRKWSASIVCVSRDFLYYTDIVIVRYFYFYRGL
jgi:hypothetical protein